MGKHLRSYEPGLNALSDTLIWTDLVPDTEYPERYVMDPKTGQRWHRLTERQKMIAEEIVAGYKAREACKNIGMRMKPESASAYVSTLFSNCAPFTNHVLILLERRQRSQVVTSQNHLQRLDDLGRRAEKEGKYSAAIAAEVARGRVAGLYAKDEAPKDQAVAKSVSALEDRIKELLEKSQRAEREVQGRVVSDQDGKK